MDFITDLPIEKRTAGGIKVVERSGCILVFSDRLTKMIHLSGFRKMSTARETIRAFQTEIFRLYYLKGEANEEWLDYLHLDEFCYNNATHATTRQSPFLAMYNYHVQASTTTAQLVHSLGTQKVVDSFAHNLENLKHVMDINRRRYLDNYDK
eukprot:jgi/Orpsp1_1/1188122/evm.model.d7180000062592.2